MNVHVKDRPLAGTTVPLGQGNVNFPLVFDLLNKHNYSRNYILQTARAIDENHASALSNYKDMVRDWLAKNES